MQADPPDQAKFEDDAPDDPPDLTGKVCSAVQSVPMATDEFDGSEPADPPDLAGSAVWAVGLLVPCSRWLQNHFSSSATAMPRPSESSNRSHGRMMRRAVATSGVSSS